MTARLVPTIAWLQSLASCPLPTGPRCVARCPRRARTGRTRATSSAAPPQRKMSVPFCAPRTPPETGASTQRMPAEAASRAAMSRVARGEMLEQSTSNVPARAPAAMPSVPKTTASTAALSDTHRNTMSARRATSAGDVHGAAPAAQAARSFAAFRLKALTREPASSSRRTIGSPILPSATKPSAASVVVMRDLQWPFHRAGVGHRAGTRRPDLCPVLLQPAGEVPVFPWSPRRRAPRELGGGQVDLDARALRVDADAVAVLEQRDRPAVRRLGAGIADAHAARGTGKPAVGQQRHAFPHALPVDQRRHAQHLAHAGPALRALVADDEH